MSTEDREVGKEGKKGGVGAVTVEEEGRKKERREKRENKRGWGGVVTGERRKGRKKTIFSLSELGH